MNKALTSVINFRIVLILIETLVVFYIYNQYKIHLDVDFNIISIAIVFPLVFSITSAYQRRQDSIKYFTEFRNKMIDLSNIFYAVDQIEKKTYKTLFNELATAQSILIDYLKGENSANYDLLREKRKDILKLIDSKKTFFNEREKDSLIRVKNEMFLAAEQIRGIKIHGTPVSMRKYCLFFIYLSPLLFNSQLASSDSIALIGLETGLSIVFSMAISFVLMALYNVQDYIENPFDQKGLDDLKIDFMQVNDWESLYV